VTLPWKAVSLYGVEWPLAAIVQVAAAPALSDRADAGSDTLDGDLSGAVVLSDIPTGGPDTRGVQVLAVLAVSDTLSDRVRHPEREVPVHATLDIDMTFCVPAGLSTTGRPGPIAPCGILMTVS
jgi:hypothetical protein